VASRGRPDLSWAGSTQLGPDLAGAVREIRDRHEHVKVVGSLNLVQTLLREKLFDRLDLWVHPVVLTQRASFCVLRCPGMIAEIWAAAAEHYDESQLSSLLLKIGAINRVEPPEGCYRTPAAAYPS
jgi:hypothetical protein